MNDKQRNQRLLRTYGITLEEYNQMLAEHDGGCWICGRKAVTRALAVDHDHRYKQVKVGVVKLGPGLWQATAFYRSRLFVAVVNTKRGGAVRAIKRDLKKASVRGILCYQDNSGLQKFSDDPERLARASEYLRRFNGESN